MVRVQNEAEPIGYDHAPSSQGASKTERWRKLFRFSESQFSFVSLALANAAMSPSVRLRASAHPLI
jgi:hypothetical protein